MEITQLPFNELVGLEHSPREGCLLRLPAGHRYTNHLGTVHAGALMALAEATSGEFLLRTFADVADQIVPVVRRFECKFKKPAQGEITSLAHCGEVVLEAFHDTFARKGRATLEVTVTLLDHNDAAVMTASVEWFIAKAG